MGTHKRLSHPVLLVFVACWTFPLSVSSARAQEAAQEAEPQEPGFAALVGQLTAHLKRVDPQTETLPRVDFPEGKEWFNSPPLSLSKELHGKITILDFWTYCCINCIHVLPDLAALEEKYAGSPVAFVGVHSAKFDNEKDSENIRQAVLRYEIHHPVVNDDEMTLWRAIGVSSWPTVVVIGPKGNLILMVSGEGNKMVLDACITAALRFYSADLFRHDPVPIRLEKEKPGGASPLRYPGKVAVDAARKQLFISDSNNNRIVVTDLEGNFVEAIGRGPIGLVDGAYDAAKFNRLQGVALDGAHLYVADSENHALRRVDLDAKEVVTLAGNGTQGRDYQGGKGGREQLLSTPWDVAVDDKLVYVAMAGTHQIWVYDKESGACRNYSGSGREQNLNHADPRQAAWAQPSGLTIGAGWLFVADSESSSIRGVELASGRTTTFVGGEDANPRNLFAFGDQDGKGDEARLQHCLGVLWLENEKRVLVADTYNHRLKLVDHESRTVKAFAGSGKRGARDGKEFEAEFSEPSGLAAHPDGKRIYVADTNNHQIRLLDLESLEVTTLKLQGVPRAAASVPPRSLRLADLPGTQTIKTETLKLKPGGDGEIKLRLTLPAEHHYTKEAGSAWQVLAEEAPPVQVEEAQARGQLVKDTEEITIPVKGKSFKGSAKAFEGSVKLEALAYFCKENGACLLGAIVFEIPVEIGEGGRASVELSYTFEDRSQGFGSPLELKTE